MSVQMTSSEWVAGHIGRQPWYRRNNYATGVTEYRVQKGADEWIMTKRLRWWHPLCIIGIPLFIAVIIIVMIVAWPWMVWQMIHRVFKELFTYRVVDCIAVEDTTKNQAKGGKA